MLRKSDSEVTPRNGHELVSAIVARISGCAKQKELSLDDQEAHGKDVTAGYYQGKVEYRTVATKGKGEWLDRPELQRSKRCSGAAKLIC